MLVVTRVAPKRTSIASACILRARSVAVGTATDGAAEDDEDSLCLDRLTNRSELMLPRGFGDGYVAQRTDVERSIRQHEIGQYE